MRSFNGKPSRPRLSVGMIVRNEEAFLADAIESVRSIADELVVLDTGSTDRTVAIASELGAKVGRISWPQDFAAARNACLDLVQGDWVLWLDAGEQLVGDSAPILRSFLNEQADRRTAYMLMIEAPPAPGAITGEEVARLRLMPVRSGLRFEGRIRETLRPAIEAAGMEIDIAPGRIARHPRHQDLAWRTYKANRDLGLAALETAEAAASPRVLMAQGEAYSNLGLFDQGRQAFCDAIDAAPRGSTEMLEAYYGLLTCYACDPFLRHHQLTVCLEALAIFPVDIQLLLALGNYLHACDRMALAVRAFDTAVRHGQVDLEAWHLRDVEKVAEICLNAILGIPAQAPSPPPEVVAGRKLRIHGHGDAHETAGPLHLPLAGDVLASHTVYGIQ